MKYTARKFNQTSYNENDKYAKNKIKKYLINRGHKILKEVEDYDHDLVTERDGKKFYFEFEVKRNYPFTGKDDYKFNSVSFLGRKLRLHLINPFYYCILCYETDFVVFCHSNDIFKEEYKQNLILKRHTRQGNDEMYRVPLKKCNFFCVK